MILHKKTFNKFGYWPNKLSKQSSRKVITKCSKCSIQRELRCYQARLVTRCRKCNKITDKNYQHVYISDFQIVDIIFNSYYAPRDKYRGQPSLSINRKHFTADEKFSIFKKLNIPEKSVNTTVLKLKALEYILNLHKPILFNCFQYMLSKYITPFQYGKGYTWMFSDSLNRIRYIFDNLGFKYTIYSNQDLALKYGSFYYNDKWIHVG